MRLKVLEKEAQNITRQIVAKYHPEKVVLFGSVARGNKDPHDIDILVIKETRAKKIRRAQRLYNLIDYAHSLDLLVRTPREVKTALAEGNYFLGEVFADGKVLYDKSQS